MLNLSPTRVPQAKSMRLRHLRSLLVAAFFLVPLALAAQVPTTKPTPEQARILLQTRPDLVERLRQEMMSSGMTPEQIRARLRAEGYPENLLDAYMPGARGEAGQPSSTMLRAIQELGIADTTDLLGLNGLPMDSLGFDSLRVRQVRSDTSVLARSVSPFRPDTIRDRMARDSVIRLITSPDSGFVIFGLDVFRSSTSQFQPNLAGPVDANYRVGPGDRLVLILTGDVEESHSLDVTREGLIVIPSVGQLYVNNMTLGELEALLYSRLGRVYSGVRRGGGTTRFSINVARLRSNQVFVVGAVQRPGSYMVSSAGTAMTALYAAGGPSINGSLRRIEVRRAGRTVETLDVYDYLVRGDASHDVRLQTGDMVFVTVHGPRARVVGEVIRPATYELKPGEGLPQLLEAAGGFTASAALQRVFVERILPASERGAPGRERTTIDVSSAGLANGQGVAMPIQNGDVVRVFPISERVRNRILVRGNVYTPGPQGLAPGMKLSDALRGAGGVQPDTYLGEVLISRMRSDSTRIQLRARLQDTTGAVINDLPLQEDDQIQVFSVSSFRPVRYVAIAGYVNRPGRFAYREGMTVRDLVLLAHGVKEGARLTDAEIARLPEDRSGGQTAVTVRVPLDSTYLFERGANGRYAGPPGQPAPSGGAPEVTLAPYDNVLILRQENFEYQRNVVLNGEVKFPGTYALKNKREHLRDLIVRAGGLTEEAQGDGIIFVRKGSSTYEATPTIDPARRGAGMNGTAGNAPATAPAGPAGTTTVVARTTATSEDEVSTLVLQDSVTRFRVTNGRIGIDLSDVMRHPDSRDNIVLEDGDEITIPRYNPVVRVQGAVNAPANVTFVPGRDVYYYVSAAGGAARTADEGRAYVTQPSGKLESVRGRGILPDAVPVPQAGAVVTVPEKDPTDKRDYIALAGVLAQVLASLVTAVVLLRRPGG
jgi:polysaccharide export outer membrane protein